MSNRLVMLSVLLGWVSSSLAASPVSLRCDEPGDCALIPAKDDKTPLTKASLRKVHTLNLADIDLDGPGLELLKEATALESLTLLRTTGVAALQRLPLTKLQELSVTQARGLTLEALARLATAPRLTHLRASDLPFAPLLGAFTKTTHLSEVSLKDVELNDEALALVSTLPALRVLRLEASGPLGITDVGLASLVKASGLQTLSVIDRGDQQLSGQGLSALVTLSQLEQLEFQGSSLARLDPALSTAWPRLVSLGLWNSKLDDEGLTQLAKSWPGLRELHVGSHALSDEGVARGLALLPALQRLELLEGGDGALAAAAKLTKLKTLWVVSGEMTDAGLLPLSEAKQLRELRLTSALFTDAAGASLRKLPQLTSLSFDCRKCTDVIADDIVTLRKLTYLHLFAPLSSKKHRWLYEALHL